VFRAVDVTGVKQPRMDTLIDLASGVMIRCHDQRPIRLSDVGVGDRCETVGAADDFVDASLMVQLLNRGVNLAAREVFDDLFEGRVLLSDDVIQSNGFDAGVLQLLIRPAGFDGLMLAGIADDEDAIVRAQAVQELVHLLGTGQARLVDDIEL
jgi:hypothetical protein